jgi:hypothetical protein
MITSEEEAFMAHIPRIGRAALLLAGLSASGCAGTTIHKILSEPDQYRRREVSLKGHVVQSLSVLGREAYKLDDGTGTLVVVSRAGVPRRGAWIETRGKLVDVVDLGRVVRVPSDVSRDVGSGLVMIEHEHRAR